jgi:hypothetical protein
MSASKRRKRKRFEPTHEWERLVALFEWPEQENYEVIRPLVLRGRARGKGGRHLAAGEEPHLGARRRTPFPLRGGARSG